MNTKLIGALLFFVFLSGLSFSLFYMSPEVHMAGGASDCPLMVHGEVLCAMNVVDHIGAWQSVFLAVVPTFLLTIFAIVSAVILCTTAPHLLTRLSTSLFWSFRYVRERLYTFPYRPLQELFAKGILHPKLF